jgi:ABC-type antimicrobial peptide transport system permease subunit
MERMWSENLEDWTRTRIHTFVQLQKGTSAKELNQKIAGIVKRYQPEANMGVSLQPLTDVHLRSNFLYDEDNVRQESITSVYIFSLIALFILLIACINFMNLSTARSANRAKEIGMRKVLGADRKDIIKQFLGESIILTFISLLLALVLVYLFLPLFSNLSGKQISLAQDFFGNIKILVGLIAITLLTGIMSGSYPALFLSSFKPVKVLRGFSSVGRHIAVYLRKILVVGQFAIAIILIIATVIIYSQLDYIRNKDMGFDKENLVCFKSPFEILVKYDVVRNELLKHPNILEMSQGRIPGNLSTMWSNFNWEGKSPQQEVRMILCTVHYAYLKTLKMEMVEGRWFSEKFPTDPQNYVLNETAIKTMGIQSPLGKRFSFEGQEGSIIGVVKDCHLSSLHHEKKPVVYNFSMFPHIMVRIKPENVSKTINFIENQWKQIVPHIPFQYFFLDEAIDNIYKSEQQLGSLFKYFTFLAIFISSLGLLGLASHMAERRTKEIGTRKVFGASISGIVLLLSKEFVKWVIVALIVACPIVWYVMNKWLENFGYRITIEWWIFLLGGGLAMVIAVFTVSYQTIKAARANPVDSLRHE